MRSAVAAAEGQRLLVADYGQLELRLVAHLADCPDMISILSEGGDIHSRTAYRMFQEVQEAVDGGEVALDSLSLTQKKSAEEERRPRSERSADSELPPEPAPPRLPLVAERFPELRRRAKTLNFSLLYGKTAPWRIKKQKQSKKAKKEEKKTARQRKRNEREEEKRRRERGDTQPPHTPSPVSVSVEQTSGELPSKCDTTTYYVRHATKKPRIAGSAKAQNERPKNSNSSDKFPAQAEGRGGR